MLLLLAFNLLVGLELLAFEFERAAALHADAARVRMPARTVVVRGVNRRVNHPPSARFRPSSRVLIS